MKYRKFIEPQSGFTVHSTNGTYRMYETVDYWYLVRGEYNMGSKHNFSRYSEFVKDVPNFDMWIETTEKNARKNLERLSGRIAELKEEQDYNINVMGMLQSI